MRELRKRQRSLPSLDPHDPGYRRLRYVRYADDILLGFTGPKAEAEEIKRRLAQFLREDLKLELSETKTLITHARTSAARFLGYEIITQYDNRKQTAGRRSVNGQIRLRVPVDVIKAKCSRYTKGGKPADRPELMNELDHTIINCFGAEYRGIVQYYLLAGDVYRLNRLHWVMQTSLLKTLAGKYGSTVTTMARRYKATIETPHGPHKCLQASVERGQGRKPLVATFGGIPLKRQKHAALKDRAPAQADRPRQRADRSAPRWTVRDLRQTRTRCKSTRSASSQTSTNPGSQTNPNGPGSWPSDDARPSWSAPPPPRPRRGPGARASPARALAADHQHLLESATAAQRPLAPTQRRAPQARRDRRGRDRPRARRLLLGDRDLEPSPRPDSAGIPTGGRPPRTNNLAPTEAQNHHPSEAHQLTLNPAQQRCGWRGGPRIPARAHQLRDQSPEQPRPVRDGRARL